MSLFFLCWDITSIPLGNAHVSEKTHWESKLQFAWDSFLRSLQVHAFHKQYVLGEGRGLLSAEDNEIHFC